MRLSAANLGRLSSQVAFPTYLREGRASGIVHLGAGAFLRSHLASYTDAALAAAGGDWSICAVSMRSSATVDALCQQDGLYTLLERSRDATSAQVIGSITEALSLKRDRDRIVSVLSHPETRIVSLTVTEKAYAYDAATEKLNSDDPAIASDLARPDEPGSVVGLLVQVLAKRKDAKASPVAVLSCDNLPANGKVARRTVTGFARLLEPSLADWIENEVSFPSTMVDRITPEANPATFADASKLTGFEDLAAVECESYRQWVIEDDFPSNRPAWDEVGAIMVEDVTPYELMKLRMLNGSHSLLAYAGFVAGYKYVGDCMACKTLGALVKIHMQQVSGNLLPLAGINYAQYATKLCERFANPALAHATYQIAADGSQKMPQRILLPAFEAYRTGQSLDTYAFALAAWVRYCRGSTEDGDVFEVKDPLAAKFATCLAEEGSLARISAFMALIGLAPSEPSAALACQAAKLLDVIESEGMLAAASGMIQAR